MHHHIDSLAYTNRLRSLPPEHKLLFAIALFTVGFIAPIPVQLAIAIWMAVWVVGYAKIPGAVYGKLLAIPVSFWVMSVPALVIGGVGVQNLDAAQADIVQGFTVGPWYLYVSYQGLMQVGVLLARAIALTSCMYFILFTVPLVELLRVMQRLGCPTLMAELLLLMYRFIFVLTDTVLELLTAQQSRLGYCTWRISMRSLSILISQLLIRTLNSYRQIAMGLASRNFNGELRVLHTRRYQPNRRYSLEAVSGLFLLLICTGWHW